MNIKCVECGLTYSKPMHETEKGLLCDICFEAKKVWDKWRNGEMSHDQAQAELNKILGPETKEP